MFCPECGKKMNVAGRSFADIGYGRKFDACDMFCENGHAWTVTRTRENDGEVTELAVMKV